MFEFIKSNDIDFDSIFKIEKINKNEFILKIVEDDYKLYLFYKNQNIALAGSKELINKAANIIIESNIIIKELFNDDLSKIFLEEYIHQRVLVK